MSNKQKEQLPFGTWPSPVTPELAAGKSLRLGMLAGAGGDLFWSESRPEEQGRGAIMRGRAGGGIDEVLPAPYSARSRVHEYGGGEFLVSGSTLYFVEAETQDIHRLTLDSGEEPERLTDIPDMRFADMTADAVNDRLFSVAERTVESDEALAYPENLLVCVSSNQRDSEACTVVAKGHDFYASPRVSPDGKTLAFLAWDLPHMPWEAATLYIGDIASEGSLENVTPIAGGEGNPAFQPEWHANGDLLFVWDESGWGNLYRWRGGEVAAITQMEEELLRPQWVFAMRSYAILGDGMIAAVFLKDGGPVLRLVDPDNGPVAMLDTSLREIGSIVAFGKDPGIIGTGDRTAPAVIRLNRNDGERQVLRNSLEIDLQAGDVSCGELIRVKGRSGEDIFALYYPPANANHEGPKGVLPPVVVMVHGGPTAQTDRGLKIKIQYWTSRGFAVCDIDYSGSTGYGRAYRERLNGQWGIRDVEDVDDVVRHLTANKLADPEKRVISGGSAGGYTVLMALANTDIFAAGGCSYAVCDLAQLHRITHKFEGEYLYSLTGTNEENCDKVFAARSPLKLAARIAAPVIFFQGSEDKVVPPEQSRDMSETLKRNGIETSYHEFEGEGHGFRQKETIEAVFALEHAFYLRCFGV